ncbi:MAG: hypothetical protein U1F66_10985 [bacterium]
MHLSRYFIAVAVLLAAVPALADSPMTGTWTIVEAKTGSWYDGSGAKPEVDPELAHAKVIFTKNSVRGPSALACARVKFTVSTVGPEYLFQGVLKNPAKDAAALGFKGKKITSVNEGCLRSDADMEMDFALVDKDTAVFGLNNMVYKMKRIQP